MLKVPVKKSNPAQSSQKRGTAAHKWLVYILRCGDGSFYTGITNDLSRRLETHKTGKASRYTRSRLPVKLVYVESAGDRSVALRREILIKQMRRQQKEGLVDGGERR